MTTSLVKVFNNHLLEFIDDVIRIFPNNIDLKTGKTFVEGVKKINPKSLIKIWKTSVVDLYKKQIDALKSMPEYNNTYITPEDIMTLVKTYDRCYECHASASVPFYYVQ